MVGKHSAERCHTEQIAGGRDWNFEYHTAATIYDSDACRASYDFHKTLGMDLQHPHAIQSSPALAVTARVPFAHEIICFGLEAARGALCRDTRERAAGAAVSSSPHEPTNTLEGSKQIFWALSLSKV